MTEKRNPRGAGRKRILTRLEELGCYQEYLAGVPLVKIAYKAGISLSTLNRIIKREKREKEEKKRITEEK